MHKLILLVGVLFSLLSASCSKDDDDGNPVVPFVPEPEIIYEADISVEITEQESWVIGDDLSYKVTFDNDSEIEQVLVQVVLTSEGVTRVLDEFEEEVNSADPFVYENTVKLDGFSFDATVEVIAISSSIEDPSKFVLEKRVVGVLAYAAEITFFAPTAGAQVPQNQNLQVQATVEGSSEIVNLKIELRQFDTGTTLYTEEFVADPNTGDAAVNKSIPADDVTAGKLILYVRTWHPDNPQQVISNFVEFDAS